MTNYGELRVKLTNIQLKKLNLTKNEPALSAVTAAVSAADTGIQINLHRRGVGITPVILNEDIDWGKKLWNQ